MRHLLACGLLAFGLTVLGLAPGRAADDEAKAIKALEKLGGEVERRDNDPAKPVGFVCFDNNPLTDADLKHFAALKDVDWIAVRGGKGVRQNVTDAGLKHFAGLKQLRRLELCDTKVTGTGLKSLTDLPKLKELRLLNCPLTLDGAKAIAALPHLEELDLSLGPAPEVVLKPLAGKPLRRLDLIRSTVTDLGLVHVANLSELRMLQLQGTKITDAGLWHLTRLENLRTLDLTNTKVTDAGVKELQKALPKCEVRR